VPERLYRVVIHEHGKPPFEFLAASLEPGEVWSTILAALKLLDREKDWTLQIGAVREITED
jgi:hypothetical protein